MQIYRILSILSIIVLLSSKANSESINLLKNTEIRVVAPASGVKIEIIDQIKSINSLKLDIPNKCFINNPSNFHSNTDSIRFNCLKDALLADDDSVIWALRGGYGSSKLIHQLKNIKPPKEKFFVGYSDMTALHIFFSQKWGWKTIHGSMISELLNPDKNKDNFLKVAKIVAGKVKQTVISDLIPMNAAARSIKNVEGSLTGGNLTIVQTSIGTEWEIDTISKILFLEDLNLEPYELDRALYHLKQAGIFSHVRAIVFGNLGSESILLKAAMLEFASALEIPVYKSNSFGHGATNEPLIYNSSAKIIPSSQNNSYNLIMKI